MIGWINLSVEAFVRDSFGDAAWEAILEKTKEDPSWVRNGIHSISSISAFSKQKKVPQQSHELSALPAGLIPPLS